MTKDVLIRVKGLQMMNEGEPAEPIEIITVGDYYYRNGHHYIRYEEVQEGFEDKIINYIKIGGSGLEVRKKGMVHVQMVFEKGKKNFSCYQTPYGIIEMGISTTNIYFEEEEHRIDVRADYALEMDGMHVADCYIQILIQSKNVREFHM